MPTQQKTADPLASPTSEKEMTRPVWGWVIFCERRGEQRYDSTASSTESADPGRSLPAGGEAGCEGSGEAAPTRESLRGLRGPAERRLSLEALRLSLRVSRGAGLCLPERRGPARSSLCSARRRPLETEG